MWAESYDRVMEDVFDMQSEIASEVVAQLGITLLEPSSRSWKRATYEDLGAYQAYLRGRHGQSSSVFLPADPRAGGRWLRYRRRARSRFRPRWSV